MKVLGIFGWLIIISKVHKSTDTNNETNNSIFILLNKHFNFIQR